MNKGKAMWDKGHCLKSLLYCCGIIECCPNCESALTGGADPVKVHQCVVCSNTGWVWGGLVDPFSWLSQRTVAKNLRMKMTPRD